MWQFWHGSHCTVEALVREWAASKVQDSNSIASVLVVNRKGGNQKVGVDALVTPCHAMP